MWIFIQLVRRLSKRGVGGWVLNFFLLYLNPYASQQESTYMLLKAKQILWPPPKMGTFMLYFLFITSSGCGLFRSAITYSWERLRLSKPAVLQHLLLCFPAKYLLWRDMYLWSCDYVSRQHYYYCYYCSCSCCQRDCSFKHWLFLSRSCNIRCITVVLSNNYSWRLKWRLFSLDG